MNKNEELINIVIGTQGIIFMIDGNDEDKFETAKKVIIY